MKQAICTLKSTSPYSQGRFHNTPKLPKEAPDAHEERTWMERLHYDKNQQVFIPPMQFANCIKEAAKYLSMKIPGDGNNKYTKHFEAGVMVIDPLQLPIRVDEVHGDWRHVPSDGRPGGTKRVMKCFPVIPEWSGQVVFYVLDDKITENVFRYVLEQAGQLIGIGSFRPRNRGYFGRFEVESMQWIDQAAESDAA